MAKRTLMPPDEDALRKKNNKMKSVSREGADRESSEGQRATASSVREPRVRCPECLGTPCDCNDPDWDSLVEPDELIGEAEQVLRQMRTDCFAECTIAERVEGVVRQLLSRLIACEGRCQSLQDTLNRNAAAAVVENERANALEARCQQLEGENIALTNGQLVLQDQAEDREEALQQQLTEAIQRWTAEEIKRTTAEAALLAVTQQREMLIATWREEAEKIRLDAGECNEYSVERGEGILRAETIEGCLTELATLSDRSPA